MRISEKEKRNAYGALEGKECQLSGSMSPTAMEKNGATGANKTSLGNILANVYMRNNIKTTIK